MARYPATKEGANQLLDLANALRESAQQIASSNMLLRNRLDSLAGDHSSGILAEIEELVDSTMEKAAEIEEPIEQLANKLTKLSSRITCIVGSNRESFLSRIRVDVSGGKSTPRINSGGNQGSDDPQRQRSLFPSERGDER